MEALELRMSTNLADALPQQIGFNFDELKGELTKSLVHYRHMIVTEDTIQECKADLANLRKLRDALDTRRKDVKKQWNQPLTTFESQIKELVALIDEPVRVIDGQIKGFAEQERERKLGEIRAAYEEIFPGSLKEIFPLDRILDQKWLNKSTTMKSIRAALEEKAKRGNVDLALIEGVMPQYKSAVRAKYIETLDVNTALDYQDELMASEARFKAQEEARQHHLAQMAEQQSQIPAAEEKPPVAAQEPVRQPIPQPPVREKREKLLPMTLAFQITQTQATALKQFLEDNNIIYTRIV